MAVCICTLLIKSILCNCANVTIERKNDFIIMMLSSAELQNLLIFESPEKLVSNLQMPETLTGTLEPKCRL